MFSSLKLSDTRFALTAISGEWVTMDRYSDSVSSWVCQRFEPQEEKEDEGRHIICPLHLVTHVSPLTRSHFTLCHDGVIFEVLHLFIFELTILHPMFCFVLGLGKITGSVRGGGGYVGNGGGRKIIQDLNKDMCSYCAY